MYVFSLLRKDVNFHFLLLFACYSTKIQQIFDLALILHFVQFFTPFICDYEISQKNINLDLLLWSRGQVAGFLKGNLCPLQRQLRPYLMTVKRALKGINSAHHDLILEIDSHLNAMVIGYLNAMVIKSTRKVNLRNRIHYHSSAFIGKCMNSI